jgi:hypothetical protein
MKDKVLVIKSEVSSPTKQTILEVAARLAAAAIEHGGREIADMSEVDNSQAKDFAKWAAALAAGLALESENMAALLEEIKIEEAAKEAVGKAMAEVAAKQEAEPENDDG